MSTFTETKVLKQVTFLPQANAINVQWGLVVAKDGVSISETFERKAYSADQLPAFSTEVGAFDVNAFAAAFQVEALDAKLAAQADKATAEAALAKATSDHTEALKAANVASTALATTNNALATELATASDSITAKDAEVTRLTAELATATAEIARLTALVPVPVQGVVSMRQARLALLQAGLLDAVNAAVQAAGPAAIVEWDYANEVRRDSALIASLSSDLNLTDAQVDALFATAALL